MHPARSSGQPGETPGSHGSRTWERPPTKHPGQGPFSLLSARRRWDLNPRWHRCHDGLLLRIHARTLSPTAPPVTGGQPQSASLTTRTALPYVTRWGERSFTFWTLNGIRHRPAPSFRPSARLYLAELRCTTYHEFTSPRSVTRRRATREHFRQSRGSRSERRLVRRPSWAVPKGCAARLLVTPVPTACP